MGAVVTRAQGMNAHYACSSWSSVVRDIYTNGTYLRHYTTWHEEDSPWKSEQIVKLMKRNHLKPSTICEVGCGAGEILRQLSNRLDKDIQFVGYEISPQAFDICKRKSMKNLIFFQKDLLEDRETVYDIVMAIDVVEHVEDCWGFLRRLRSRGRYKIFHIPLDLSVQSVLRASRLTKASQTAGHIHYFTQETALATLEDTGYTIRDYFYTGTSLELPQREWKARLMKIPRRLFFSVNPDLTVRILGGFSLMVLAE